MDSGGEAFPNDIAALKAALAAARDRHIIEAARAAYAEAELAVARAKASDDQALIAYQQLRIEKLTRELYGPLGTHVAPSRSDRVAVRGTGEFGDRRRDRGRDGGGHDHDGGGLHPQAPGAQAVPRTSTA